MWVEDVVTRRESWRANGPKNNSRPSRLKTKPLGIERKNALVFLKNHRIPMDQFGLNNFLATWGPPHNSAAIKTGTDWKLFAGCQSNPVKILKVTFRGVRGGAQYLGHNTSGIVFRAINNRT